MLSRASKHDCDARELKARCCPKMPAQITPAQTNSQASSREVWPYLTNGVQLEACRKIINHFPDNEQNRTE
jgi:hypothetical protein